MSKMLIEAMQAQIANPTRAVVNSESAFVKDRLNKLGQTSLASEYWNWVCMYRRGVPNYFGEEVAALQEQLDAIDKGVEMPAWGTYGT